MDLQLRPYQLAAVDAVYGYLRTHEDNPAVVMPTASGKSWIIAQLVRDAVLQWSGRVLVLAHVKELLQQNADKIRRICPDLKIGIYSAGMNRRDITEPVIVAGIQSVYKRACELDAFDLVIIDECFIAGTSVSTPTGDVPIEEVQPGMYVRHAMGIGQVLAVSARIVHDLVTLEYANGTSITCTPNHPIFTERGWKNAGSLELGSLAMGVEDLRVLRESLSTLDEAVDGRSFNNSKREAVAPATILFDLLLEDSQQLHVFGRGPEEGKCDPQGARTRTKDSRGQWPVDQCATGAVKDARPGVGCGACCACSLLPEQGIAKEPQDRCGQSTAHDCHRARRPQSSFATTQDARFPQDLFFSSKRLVRITHHQPVGRQIVFNLHVAGHPSYFANGILVHNCHLIPIEGEGMYRQFLVAAGYSRCPVCNFEFPRPERAAHDAQASTESVLSVQVIETTYTVRDVFYSVHIKQGADESAPKTVRVDYKVGLYQRKSEWICFEHNGWPRQKAEQWWRDRSHDPIPATAEQAVDFANAGALAFTRSITVRSVSGEKFDTIVDYELGEKPEAMPIGELSDIGSDDIPF
jgi:hypothetical protein